MVKANPLPSQAELDELLSYEPLTGVLRWKVSNSNRALVGSEAGGKSSKGYLTARINNQRYPNHRLIWVLQTGTDPGAKEVDHINLDRADNRWSNLRLADHQQNCSNSRGQSQCGLPKGVSRCRKRFRARIRVNGLQIHIGTFDTPELAHEAYCAAAKQHFGEFWRAA